MNFIVVVVSHFDRVRDFVLIAIKEKELLMLSVDCRKRNNVTFSRNFPKLESGSFLLFLLDAQNRSSFPNQNQNKHNNLQSKLKIEK